MKAFIFSCIFVIVLSISSFSQITGGGSSTSNSGSNTTTSDKRAFGNLFGVISLPTGDFKEEGNGCAKTGFGLGYDYMAGSKNVKFLWEQLYTYHPAEYTFTYNYDYGYGYNDTYTFTSNWGYLTAMQLFGIRAQGGSNGFAFYGQAGIGAAFCALTGDLNEAGLGISFAYAFGAGVIISDHLNIGLRIASAKPKFPDMNDVEQKISTFNLTVGYEF